MEIINRCGKTNGQRPYSKCVFVMCLMHILCMLCKRLVIVYFRVLGLCLVSSSCVLEMCLLQLKNMLQPSYCLVSALTNQSAAFDLLDQSAGFQLEGLAMPCNNFPKSQFCLEGLMIIKKEFVLGLTVNLVYD